MKGSKECIVKVGGDRQSIKFDLLRPLHDARRAFKSRNYIIHNPNIAWFLLETAMRGAHTNSRYEKVVTTMDIFSTTLSE